MVKIRYTVSVMESFFQTDAWGELKSKSGWVPKRVASYLAMFKAIFGRIGFWYFPELPWEEEVVKNLASCYQTLKNQAMFARFEFLTPYDPEKAKTLTDLGFIKSFEEVQPEYRQILSITPTDEEILTQMKKNGRYNIRLSLKKSLNLSIGTTPDLVKRFFKLYQKTAQRSKFTYRDVEYFLDLVKTLEKTKSGEVIIVSHSKGDLSAGIFLYHRGVASYLYGGSDGDRNLMAPYRMHWEAIRRAKEKDCHTYDLIAVSPPGEANHYFAGITRFKEQFGGEKVRLLGSWDYVYRPSWYKIYSLLETKRRKKRR